MFIANHDDRTRITASPGKMLAMRGLRELRFAGAALALLLVSPGIASAQTYKVVHNFCTTTDSSGYCADGQFSEAPLVGGSNGDLYGMTNQGGAADVGTVFKMTQAGKVTTLHNFCSLASCADGYLPRGRLLLAKNGKFYGTTIFGGPGNYGTVFEITPAGALTTLYSFCSKASCADGSDPGANLIQGTSGNLYGTTEYGGPTGSGTVFELTPSGELTTIYTFCKTKNASGQCSDGRFPVTGLIQGVDGDFYGTTALGGPNNDYGTVFKLTPAGKLTTLHAFCAQASCADGYYPASSLMQAANGNIYGVVADGGPNGDYGLIFQITPAGNLTTFHSFCDTKNASGYCTDGRAPQAGLIQATDGNLYSTTTAGGKTDQGTVYEVTPASTLTTLYNFCSRPACTDGGNPLAGLFQAPSGILYGTTPDEGAHDNSGTVYTLSTGLAPFVSLVPTSGKAGSPVMVLGDDLTGATSVTFNGAPAVFTIVSATEIKATVPAGATTGTVSVTTPAGVLDSSTAFHIR